MNDLLLLFISLCLTVAAFELSRDRRRLVVGAFTGAAALAFLGMDLSAGRGSVVAAMAGIPTGYLVYTVFSFVRLSKQ